jgi:hypothetical protein
LLVGDITETHLKESDTAICIDVLEHIPEQKIETVLLNLARSKRQVINISNSQSPVEGEELHINIKTFDEWKRDLSLYFKIVREIVVRPGNMLYWTKRR